MSDIIVLVKQVPDVSQITDNAFDPKTGNLIRTRLASVINELDAQALAFANYMQSLSQTTGRVIALTMGPPMAAEVLRYSLSRCADAAVLLTDRSLGGADTWATANPLAYAIRKISKELLGGTDDYFVVAGMQSVDGDTAQVPAQIAEELNLPCIAYATDVELRAGQFTFTRIISGGSQVVQTLRKPAVITVAKYEYPLFASFGRRRKAAQMELIQWGAAEVQAAAVGVAGSKTRVIRVFPPGKTSRKCREVKSTAELAALLIESTGKGTGKSSNGDMKKAAYVLPAKRHSLFDRQFEGTDKEIEEYSILSEKLKAMNISRPAEIDQAAMNKVMAGDEFHKKTLEDMVNGFKIVQPEYSGEVWVMAEVSEGKLDAATLELTGKARELAGSLDTHVGVVLAGHHVKELSKELIAAGADKVYLIEHPLLAEFDPHSYRKAVSDAFLKYKPQILLYGATPQGRVLAPMVSYRVGCGLTADCTGLEIRDSSRKGQVAVLMQTRPALGGNVMATICTKDSCCQMATARPGVMKRLEPDRDRQGQVIVHAVELSESDLSLRILKTEKAHGSVQFDSEVIVSGGKGMQNRDTFDRLLDQLCASIGRKTGNRVEKGATRTAVEQGFAERIRQVGQTGTAVGPKLYVAIGISGAIQHMIGVANTETIIAINTDPHAPIFKQCDYYMVGAAEKIVPELTELLNR